MIDVDILVSRILELRAQRAGIDEQLRKLESIQCPYCEGRGWFYDARGTIMSQCLKCKIPNDATSNVHTLYQVANNMVRN